MKPLYIFLILGVASLALLFVFWEKFKPPSPLLEIEIGGEKIMAETAKTPEERRRGLSGRKSLPKNRGMLFIFDKKDLHRFWMKGMNFPLDFVWIREGEVVDISEKVAPEDYQPLKTLAPKEPVDAVLELSSGTVERLDIKIGDKARF